MNTNYTQATILYTTEWYDSISDPEGSNTNKQENTIKERKYTLRKENATWKRKQYYFSFLILFSFLFVSEPFGSSCQPTDTSV